MIPRFLVPICAALTMLTATAAAGPDSTAAAPDSAVSAGPKADSASGDSAKVRSPLLAGVLSAVVPGAGQVYNRKYVKGVLFLGAEVGLVAGAITRYQAGEDFAKEIERLDGIYSRLTLPDGGLRPEAFFYTDSTVYDTIRSGGVIVRIDSQTIHIDTTDTATAYRMSADTADFKRERYRRSAVNVGAWALGAYIWSILDAVEKTGYFDNDEKRKPAVAGWLSAIPCLGLGQFYNGKLSKAGMILMVQSSLAVLSYNYNSEMLRCEEELQRMAVASSAEFAADALKNGTFSDEWYSMWRDARRNRNMYLWYSLFFYFYGIFDAVVDANLHDFKARMRLEPDLQVPNKQVGLRLSFDY
jgi:TM2 domain-containing membrane protein YozV